MRKFVPGLVMAAIVALSGPAVAAPGMSQTGLAAAIEESGAGLLQRIAHGCGAGWWRGPDGVGRCRPMRGGAVVVTPGVGVVPGVVVVPGRRGWCHRRGTSDNFRC